MFRTVVLFSLAIGLLLGGKLSRLGEVRVKRLPWILASFVLKFVAVFLAGRVSPEPVLCTALSVVTYGLLLYGLYPNLNLTGFPLVFAGIVLNFLVIVANQGRMPVDVSILDPATSAGQIQALPLSLIHQVMPQDVRLGFLADIFKWRFFSKVPTTFSVGDVLMAVGISWFILHGMLRGFSCAPEDARIN